MLLKCFCKIVLIHKSSVCGWQRWSDVIFLLAKWVGVMWWLLIWRHLSSPENSRLPISTNPCTTTFPAHTPSYSRAKNAKNESEKWKWKCTTTFPTHTLQLHIAVKMQKGSPLHLSAGQYPPAAPHCQMSIGEYRRGINNPACSQNTCVTRHRQDRQNNIWAFLPSYSLCYNRCKTCLHFVWRFRSLHHLSYQNSCREH